jgi:hypothetical protein
MRQRVLTALGLPEISDFGLMARAAHSEADRDRTFRSELSLRQQLG